MTKDELKNGLNSVREELAKIEAAARTLANQNFADIAASAHRRVTQMTEHHDLDAVHEAMGGNDEAQAPTTFDPKAGAAFNPDRVDRNPDGSLRQPVNADAQARGE